MNIRNGYSEKLCYQKSSQSKHSTTAKPLLSDNLAETKWKFYTLEEQIINSLIS